MDVNQSGNRPSVKCHMGQSGPIAVHHIVNTIEKGIGSKVLRFADDVKVLRLLKAGMQSQQISSDSSSDPDSSLEISTLTPAPTLLRLRLTRTIPF